MPRPAVTMRRKGITSSGFSGPPNDSIRMPSYGASEVMLDSARGGGAGILRFAGVVGQEGRRQNYPCGVACGRKGREDGRVCCCWPTQEKAGHVLQLVGVP